jgi:D-3-phosphoglycerate dehydrogenase / 2-oxoglutarate reductase
VIFVTLSTFVEHDDVPLRLLRESGIPFRIHDTGKRITTAELVAAGADATAVVAGVEPYDRLTLAQLPRLTCISRCGVGIDSIDLAAARDRGIAVLNTPDPPVNAVAELALAMMLALGRNLPRQALAARGRQWLRVEAHLLGARRVGIVGLGRIGRRVAQLVRAFGSEVWAADPGPDLAWCETHHVRIVPLDRLLEDSDIVSIHAARSGHSPLVLDEAAFARMRRGAILINLGRGEMVDEQALCEALASGHLFGAGLDVYGTEPYDGPLCGFDNVILTPHAATLTVETRAAMERECVAKAIAYLEGRLDPADRVV